MLLLNFFHSTILYDESDTTDKDDRERQTDDHGDEYVRMYAGEKIDVMNDIP